MRETHDGMGVTAGEFDALVEDLVATLEQFDVPRGQQDELLGLLAPMRDEIVEVESSETGTPLPPATRPLRRFANSRGLRPRLRSRPLPDVAPPIQRQQRGWDLPLPEGQVL
jgi:hypothetical protein